jgi:hypothetical protein
MNNKQMKAIVVKIANAYKARQISAQEYDSLLEALAKIMAGN